MQSKVQAILDDDDKDQKATLCSAACSVVLEMALWKRQLKDRRSNDDGTKRQALDRQECRCVCGSNVVITVLGTNRINQSSRKIELPLKMIDFARNQKFLKFQRRVLRWYDNGHNCIHHQSFVVQDMPNNFELSIYCDWKSSFKVFSSMDTFFIAPHSV